MVERPPWLTGANMCSFLLSPLARVSRTADKTLKIYSYKQFIISLYDSHQENMETELDPDANGEDEDDGGHSAELDAE